MPIFENNEIGYLNWIQENPRLLVLNMSKSNNPNYLILHRATCRFISTVHPDRSYTAGQYIKVCSENEAGLMVEMLRRVGRSIESDFHPCRRCRP